MNMKNALGKNDVPFSKYNKNLEWLGEMSECSYSVIRIFNQMGELSFGPPCHTASAT